MNNMNYVAQTTRCLLRCGRCLGPRRRGRARPDAAENLFGNPSFENGRDQWHLGCSGQDGRRSSPWTKRRPPPASGRALIRIGAVEGWGVQFGQTMEAPNRGKTYTFAVMAKSVKGPVALRLEIERQGDPYDRAAATPPQTVTNDKWTELHVTFKIDKPFPQGWFAYVSCNQRDVEFRLDMFRLTEGEYVPYEKAAREEIAAAAVALFDTGQASPTPLTGKAIAGRQGWTPVPEDATDHHFRGDAVLVNDRLALVLRHEAAGAELYGLGPAGPVLRAVLAPARWRATGKTTRRRRGGLRSQPGGRRCHVPVPRRPQADDSLRPGDGPDPSSRRNHATASEGLKIEAPCRFVVLPDFFADDIVIDAGDIPTASAEIPSENFFLHLLPDRQAIVMAVANHRTDDARIELSAGQNGRLVRSSRMTYGKGGKIWVAVLQAPGVWHQHNVTKEEAGKILAAGLDCPVFRPVASRLAIPRPVDGQLGNGCTNEERRVPQVRVVWFPRHAARRSPTLDHSLGQFSLSLLARPGPPRASPAVDEARPL